MNTGTKVLLYGVLPLALIGGGTWAFLYFRRKNRVESAREQGKADEGNFAQLVQNAQQSSIPNKFQGMSSAQLDAIWNKVKETMPAHEMGALASLYKLGRDHEHFDSIQFNQLNAKL